MIKNFLIGLLVLILISNTASSESRFGELTEMRDKKMRGKDNQWVRPHPGPFIWNHIEKEKGKFTWEEVDKHVVYAQEHNQTILATIWPHANWEQKSGSYNEWSFSCRRNFREESRISKKSCSKLIHGYLAKT